MKGLTTFGFIYTLKCTAACSHCCFSCSPLREEKMDIGMARAIIEAAIQTRQFTRIFFSGGEIFVYYDELKQLIKCVNKRLSIVCATNGFWGQDSYKTGEMVQELKHLGLDEMVISYDGFHAEYVPPQSVINILQACKKYNVAAQIQSMACQGSWRLPQTAEVLLNNLMEVCISESAVIPVGAAEKSIPKDALIYENEIISDRCLSSDAITIFPNGDIYPCCSPVCISTPLLKLGTIGRSVTADDLNSLCVNSMFIYSLRKYGVTNTCRRMWPNESKHIQLKERYVNLCDKCHDIFQQILQIKSVRNDGVEK